MDNIVNVIYRIIVYLRDIPRSYRVFLHGILRKKITSVSYDSILLLKRSMDYKNRELKETEFLLKIESSTKVSVHRDFLGH